MRHVPHLTSMVVTFHNSSLLILSLFGDLITLVFSFLGLHTVGMQLEANTSPQVGLETNAVYCQPAFEWFMAAAWSCIGII